MKPSVVLTYVLFFVCIVFVNNSEGFTVVLPRISESFLENLITEKIKNVRDYLLQP